MAMNRIQFQPGLSMPDFFARYGTEAQCEPALVEARWPDGCVTLNPDRNSANPDSSGRTQSMPMAA